ncbi:MAG: hypothetical protein KGQ16_06170 [Cyanobacteria bacterium REEB444]|nr:hypothetical protein [Cyanobacteria bacterium REEB444]
MTTTQIVKTSTGLHIEGNLIAGDYLADLVTGNLKGQAPDDFGRFLSFRSQGFSLALHIFKLKG